MNVELSSVQRKMLVELQAFIGKQGYGPHNNDEDQELGRRLSKSGATECDPFTLDEPFYVYRFDNNSYHLSYIDDKGCRELSLKDSSESKATIPTGWSRDWQWLPVIRRFTFGPHVNPKSDHVPR